MNVAWGSRLSSETKGLDVLGIRALDQNIEASLTNGITTISIRARYISILAWAIGQYFVDESAGGQVHHDKDGRAVYLNRVRFMVLAATFVDQGASRIGAMGSDYYVAEMAALVAGNTVRLPETGSLAMLNTYFGPSSALGLVESRPESSGLPFGLTARGTAMYHERDKRLQGTGLIELLRNGGELDFETAQTAIPAFSLDMTSEFGGEAELLRQALTEAWVPRNSLAATRVAQSYQKMRNTCTWLDRELESQHLSANQLIARNYDRTVLQRANGIEHEWASFEWHRRVHFALELLLAAVTKTLLNHGSMSITQVVATWSARTTSEPLAAHWNSPVKVAAALVPRGRFRGGLLKPGEFQFDPEVQALRAFEVLVSQAYDAQAIGETHRSNGPTAPAARAIEILENGDGTLAEVLLVICDECVAQRHIANTMRKMGNHQDCSLRFYPDGPVLVPTGIDFTPNYSGSRLQNTMRILADLKMLNVGADSTTTAGVIV
ncbi:hypothetical protein [Bradyrhizobium japonicum]|uniref:hypothetical protein n=1 Tax=Bradyrhizobium japonicum TaxID=375 RepID=UPI00271472FC|nr:hypothetical protein [Bradyrhizobium japonicum]WLB53900.1 hypothetical protein QIH94_42975 [Bradyrhizobium japonicum]WLB64227.1 hypothetical protein QIH96_02815 [Bradyrhizobium japonicum]